MVPVNGFIILILFGLYKLSQQDRYQINELLDLGTLGFDLISYSMWFNCLCLRLLSLKMSQHNRCQINNLLDLGRFDSDLTNHYIYNQYIFIFGPR